jgi:hypothetical protein
MMLERAAYSSSEVVSPGTQAFRPASPGKKGKTASAVEVLDLSGGSTMKHNKVARERGPEGPLYPSFLETATLEWL